MLMLIVIAALAGIAVALQSKFMGTMDTTAGTLTSTFITYGIGAAIVTIVYAIRRPPADFVRNIPWYAWTAGALGLVIVAGVGYTAPRLGLSRTLVIAVAAQLATAVLIDRSFEPSRLLGMAITIAGVWLVMR
jgi:transporter family-2 protein